jgi:membrane protein
LGLLSSMKHSKNPGLQRIGGLLSLLLKAISIQGQAILSRLHRVGMDQDIRWTRKFGARLVRVLVLAGMSVRFNQIPVRASALTYTSILSFVPLVVILSAVAGRFGYLDLLSQLIISLMDSLNLDLNLDPIMSVIDQAQKVNFQRLGLVGSIGLLFTFFLSMSNIEMAMDEIWDISQKRNWWRRIKEFTPFLILLILSVIGLGKILLKYHTLLNTQFSGTVIPHIIHKSILFFTVISVTGFIWIGLAMLYYIIPNTKVRIFPTLLGATLSTFGIIFLSRAMGHFPGLFFSRNNFIYGSLAIFPVALLMIYLFWLIVLYGAAVGFIYQRLYHPRDKTLFTQPTESMAFHQMEKEVIELLKAIHGLSGSNLLHGRRIVTLTNLTTELWDDASSIEALVVPLVDLGLVTKRKIRSGSVYAPRKPLAETDLTALHNMLLRLDPNGLGKLRTLTSFDELKHTVGILYSSGKQNPPLYLRTVLADKFPPVIP